MGSPAAHETDPYRWSETHTIPRPHTWGHTTTVSRVTSPPQTLHLGHTSTLIRVTPPPRTPHLGVTGPLGQDTMAVLAGPPTWEGAGSPGPPGTVERSVGSISSPQASPREVSPLLFSFGFHVIFMFLKLSC